MRQVATRGAPSREWARVGSRKGLLGFGPRNPRLARGLLVLPPELSRLRLPCVYGTSIASRSSCSFFAFALPCVIFACCFSLSSYVLLLGAVGLNIVYWYMHNCTLTSCVVSFRFVLFVLRPSCLPKRSHDCLLTCTFASIFHALSSKSSLLYTALNLEFCYDQAVSLSCIHPVVLAIDITRIPILLSMLSIGTVHSRPEMLVHHGAARRPRLDPSP